MMCLTTVNNKLIRIVNWIIVISMAFLVLCISLQVLNRFIWKVPMLWTEEYSRFAFVWLTMFGSAKAVREKSHIFVDVIEVLIKGKIAQVCGFIAGLVCMFFFIALVYTSIPWAMKSMEVYTESVHGVAVGLFYLCMPVSGALMILFGIEVLIEIVKGKEGEKGTVSLSQQ
ncbi:permease [Betaproteobacteria bacterium]|nr:permease [Betaproteobacteria bacterium]